MEVDVKVIETKTLTLELTEDEVKSLVALLIYFPLDSDDEEYTDSHRDFKRELYRDILDNVGLVSIRRADYITQ